MKILFIGGTGSISTSSSHLLESKGHKLTLITRGNRTERLPDDVKHITADFNYINQDLYKYITRNLWDCVVNWNIYNKDQALRDIRLFNGRIKKYYFISTTAIYGQINRPINEEIEIYNTIWDYAVSKIKAENIFREAHIKQNFPVVILRPGHTYCDFTIPTNIQGLGYGLIEQINEDEEVLIHNDGESQWTLTHSDDFAKVLSSLLALEDINGEIFNIVSSEYKTWKNIYMIYEDQLKKKINTCNVPAEFIYKKDNLLGLPIIGDKQKNMIFDNSKIRKIIPDFDDFILLEDGLKRSIHWAKENPEKVYFKKNIKLKIANIIKSYKQSKEYTFYD